MRCAKKKSPHSGALRIIFDRVELVDSVTNDTEELLALASKLYPHAPGVAPDVHARTVGLMLPLVKETVPQCLASLGVQDRRFFEVAMCFGAGGVAREASDPPPSPPPSSEYRAPV
jgi:hypothetical protein